MGARGRPAIPSFLNLPRPGGSPTAYPGPTHWQSRRQLIVLGNETPRAAQGRSLFAEAV